MKYIDLLFTGPPSADIASFVQITDDRGSEVQVGQWLHDGAFWRYRIPTELVPRMVVPSELERELKLVEDIIGGVAGAGLGPVSRAPEPSAALELRRRTRERVAFAPRKEPAARSSAAPPPSTTQRGDDWVRCPNCEQYYDPRKYELLDCAACGKKRCTAICMPSPGDPCLDCQALDATADDGGYDASANEPDRFSAGLFNGKAPAPKQRAGDKGVGIPAPPDDDHDDDDADDRDDEGAN